MRAQADVRAILLQPYGVTLLDITITYPRCATYIQQAGEAAAGDKYSEIEGHALGGRTYVGPRACCN
jgi:hypothetical protein